MRHIFSTACFLVVSSSLFGAVDFIKDVKPVLEANCVRCHRPMDKSVIDGTNKLLLDSKASAFALPTTIVPGKPEQSRLFTSTIAADDANELMPPRNAATGRVTRLKKEETEILRTWIAEGAPWPDNALLIAQKSNEIRYPGDTMELTQELHKRISETTKETTQDDMKPYTVRIPSTDGKFDMVAIPGGKFKMGSAASETGRKPDEGPQHEVEIAPFWMAKHEVRWDEYLIFQDHTEEMNIRKSRPAAPDEAAINKHADASTHPTNPYHEMSFGMGTDGFPAISMTQHAANKYCQWLSAKTGHFYRLPTEAEWEYAARAGTTTAYYWGDDEADANAHCWWDKNAESVYHKVGRKKPNPWGLHDIIGNVAEWTLDQYDATFYEKSPAANPWQKATTPYPHSVRGGHYATDDAALLRSASRDASTPAWKIVDPQLPKSIWYLTSAPFVGFRVVRPLKVPSAEEMHAYWNSGVHRDDPKIGRLGE
jgi:formylglycine-generating enzyme required for sulfatase activity